MRLEQRRWLLHPLTVSTFLTLLCGLAGVLLAATGQHTGALIFYVLAYVAGGWYSTREGVKALKRGLIEVDLLMVLAAAGAAILGHWQEGVSLLFLFSLSNALQEFAMDHTRRSVTSLMDLHPEDAWLRQGDELTRVPIDTLRVGDIVVIRPGDRIPVDGEVVEGQSWVDESAVTGESVPVTKTVGNEVFAGTVNKNGVLEVKVLRESHDSMLARIIRLVERARSQKAATQERIERLEQIYAKAVLVIVALAILIPITLGHPIQETVYRALILMVVASPCAVAIAAPSGFLSAIAAAARSGVLLKGARYLERLADVDIIALDKTGTLTIGQPQVSAVIPKPGESLERVIQLAASVETYAEHPFAPAIVRECARRRVELLPATDVYAITGEGVQGQVEGQTIRIGRPELFGPPEAEPWLYDCSQRLLEYGHTVVWVGTDKPLGLIALHDSIRPEAPQVIANLYKRGAKRIVMLTGDNELVARAVAKRVGIQEVHAGLLPEQKVEHIERLTREGTVAMVGDGINDAPALARAHVGIAMGAIGSDAALESADVVLVDDRLERLPFALELGRHSRKVVLQGLTFALAIIAILIAGTLAGVVNLSLGVIGHEGSTIVVVLSGLRLLWFRYQKRAPAAMPAQEPGSAVQSVDAT